MWVCPCRPREWVCVLFWWLNSRPWSFGRQSPGRTWLLWQTLRLQYVRSTQNRTLLICRSENRFFREAREQHPKICRSIWLNNALNDTIALAYQNSEHPVELTLNEMFEFQFWEATPNVGNPLNVCFYCFGYQNLIRQIFCKAIKIYN